MRYFRDVIAAGDCLPTAPEGGDIDMRISARIGSVILAALAIGLAAGCSDSNPGKKDSSAEGNTNTGGSPGTGGATATGGATGTGGAVATGGSGGTGGSTS